MRRCNGKVKASSVVNRIGKYDDQNDLIMMVIIIIMIMEDHHHDHGVNRFCNRECGCFVGYIIVMLNISYVLSAFTNCYPVNGQNYCFYTNGSVLSWDEAREFCTRRNSTLPIITDEDIDNVFQRFISDNNNQEVSGSDTEQMNNYVWLDAHARHVDDSVKWHWINGKTSG